MRVIGKVKFGYDIEDALYEDDYSELAETTEIFAQNFEDEYNEQFQKWVDQETDYSDPDRIAKEFDEDSDSYDEGHVFDDFL